MIENNLSLDCFLIIGVLMATDFSCCTSNGISADKRRGKALARKTRLQNQKFILELWTN